MYANTHMYGHTYAHNTCTISTPKEKRSEPSAGNLVEGVEGSLLLPSVMGRAHCNTLQHTATHCSTLHCTMTYFLSPSSYPLATGKKKKKEKFLYRPTSIEYF